jgi:hypothetical protein
MARLERDAGLHGSTGMPGSGTGSSGGSAQECQYGRECYTTQAAGTFTPSMMGDASKAVALACA